VVRSQPGQIVLETLSQKNPSQKRTGGVAQGVGPEFKSQHHTHKKKKTRRLRQLELYCKTLSKKMCSVRCWQIVSPIFLFLFITIN
jgi:hypothetical protein